MIRTLIILMLFLCHGVCYAQDSKQVQAKLERLTKELNAIETSILQARDKLTKGEQALATIDDSINATSLEIQTHKKKISELQIQISSLEQTVETLEQQKAELVVRLSHYIKKLNANQSHHPAKIILSQKKLSDVQKLSVWYEYIAKAESQLLDDIKTKAQQSHDIKQALEYQKNQLVSFREGLKSQQKQLEEKRISQQAIIDEYQAQITQQESKAQSVKARQAALARLLEKLEQAAKLEYIDLPKKFEKMVGKLPLPVDSEAITRLKLEQSLIHAPEGTVVTAIHPGRVVFSEWLRGLGLLIIIDHGQGYMSLYGNNQALMKSTGEWVERGENISLVGKSGGLSKPGLYFEIRKEGKPLDASHWIQNS